MNIPALGLGAVGAIGGAVLQAIWSTSPRRQILWQPKDAQGKPRRDQNGRVVTEALTPQVVVEESHLDQLRLTDHPVEAGAAITDHAFKLPARLRIRGAWSYAGAAPLAAKILPMPPDSSYLTGLYATLRSLQETRQVVSVVTGKRIYGAMLLESLSVSTDEKTENVLQITAEFREVLFARTQVVSVAPPAAQKTPEATAAPVDKGNVATQPAATLNTTAAAAALPGVY
ncbi:phage baseplate protein [Azospirillum argentinense]